MLTSNNVTGTRMKPTFAAKAVQQSQVTEKEQIAIRNAIGAWLRKHRDIGGESPRTFTGNYRLLLTSKSPEWTELQLTAIDTFIAVLEKSFPLSVTKNQAKNGIALQILYTKG